MRKGYSFDEAWWQSRQGRSVWDSLTPKEQKTIINYSKGPSWHTRMFSNIPKKRETKQLLKKIDLDTEQEHIWPVDRKPYAYYY